MSNNLKYSLLKFELLITFPIPGAPPATGIIPMLKPNGLGIFPDNNELNWLEGWPIFENSAF